MGNYFLEPENYTWKKALYWGNCKNHYAKSKEGSWRHRIVHGMIAFLEYLPGLGQIISVSETFFGKKRALSSTTEKPIRELSSIKIIPQQKPQESFPANEPISTVPEEQGEADGASFSSENVKVISLRSLTPPTDISLPASLPPLRINDFTPSDEVTYSFKSVHSNEMVPLNGIETRENFVWAVDRNIRKLEPVVISQSEFVSKSMTEHLMRHKKDAALNIKYVSGDKITNMEGALHTFITPICPITLSGDYVYHEKHDLLSLYGNGRRVVLSASVQPDFECGEDSEVVMRIVEVKDHPLEGQTLSAEFQPLWNQVLGNEERFLRRLAKYEEQLQKHMIYHLTKDHRLPGLHQLKQDRIQDYDQAIQMLERLITDQHGGLDIGSVLQNQFVLINEHVVSLEALFHLYVHQIRNEFSILETLLPQGYVYTINPPAIFAAQIGGVESVNLLNRLQILAFKELKRCVSLPHLKMIGFSDYSDRQALSLYTCIFQDKIVLPKQALFQGGHYSVKENYALVLHNNSDAFGQNIETEGPWSLDGVIGSYSDAACHLKRDRPDLLNHVFLSSSSVLQKVNA